MDERGTELSPVWFSATLRFASFTEDGRYFQPDVSVYTFKAVDHTSGFDRALQIGRGAERSFVNALGVRIRIALVDIETLNMLGDELDGVEVFYWVWVGVLVDASAALGWSRAAWRAGYGPASAGPALADRCSPVRRSGTQQLAAAPVARAHRRRVRWALSFAVVAVARGLAAGTPNGSVTANASTGSVRRPCRTG